MHIKYTLSVYSSHEQFSKTGKNMVCLRYDAFTCRFNKSSPPFLTLATTLPLEQMIHIPVHALCIAWTLVVLVKDLYSKDMKLVFTSIYLAWWDFMLLAFIFSASPLIHVKFKKVEFHTSKNISKMIKQSN
jgi:hypothetical protein